MIVLKILNFLITDAVNSEEEVYFLLIKQLDL